MARPPQPFSHEIVATDGRRWLVRETLDGWILHDKPNGQRRWRALRGTFRNLVDVFAHLRSLGVVVKKEARNPYFVAGTGRDFTPRATRRMSAEEKAQRLALAGPEEGGSVVHESDAEARRRRATEKRLRAAAKKSERMRARPVDLLHWIRSRWGGLHVDGRFPMVGKNEKRDLMVGGRRLFGRGRGYLRSLDALLEAMREDGYAPSATGDENARGRAHLDDVAQERLAAALAGDRVLSTFTAADAMRAEEIERDRAERQRKNPALVTLLANPTTRAQIDAARRAYVRFHGVEPKAVSTLPGNGPPLVALGTLQEVVYKPTKGQRRGPAFFHRFGRGARLAATADGSVLLLVPGKRPFRVDWKRGIVG